MEIHTKEQLTTTAMRVTPEMISSLLVWKVNADAQITVQIRKVVRVFIAVYYFSAILNEASLHMSRILLHSEESNNLPVVGYVDD